MRQPTPSRCRTLVPAAACLAAAVAAPAWANVIVSDGFEDGDFVDNPATPLDTSFSTNGSGTLSLVPLSGDTALQLDPNQGNIGITGVLPFTVSLTQPGDFVQLTVTIEYTDPSGPTDLRNGLSLGFRDASNQETGASVNPGSAAGGSQNDGLFFSGSDNNLSGRHDTTGFGLDPQTLTYRVELTDPTTVSYSLAGAVIDETGNIAEGTRPLTDFTPLSFQTLFVEQGGGSANEIDFSIDDVVVTTNVPEPASLALLAAGLGAMVFRRRTG